MPLDFRTDLMSGLRRQVLHFCTHSSFGVTMDIWKCRKKKESSWHTNERNMYNMHEEAFFYAPP
jgi:hypothetical protein